MRKLIILSILFFITTSFKQDDWVVQKLGSGVSVNFPNTPKYTLKDKNGIYALKTENNLLLAIISYDAIPNYSEFVKLKQSKQDELIETLLDNVVNGISKQSGSKIIAEKINVNGLSGRKFGAESVNPQNGKEVTKYYKVVYAANKIFMLNVLPNNYNPSTLEEKETFLNSLNYK